MANSKKQAATLNFEVDNLTTIGVIKEAKAFVKALNKDKATKEYIAEDLVSWIGDELRECEDLVDTIYEYEVILSEDSNSVIYDRFSARAFVEANVFVRRRYPDYCACVMPLRICLSKNKDNDTLSFCISRCYDLGVEDGKVNGITRFYPTY